MVLGVLTVLFGFFFTSITVVMVKERNRLAKFKGLPPPARIELISANNRLRRLETEQKGRKYVAPPKNPEAGSIVFGLMAFVCFVYGISKLVNHEGTVTPVPPQAQAALFVRPMVEPPKFRVFHQPEDANSIVPLVVAKNSTDDQIASLLWFIKDHIKAGSLISLGVKTPSGFLKSGMVEVFRGSRCASEDDFSAALPCGNANHSVAFYQWGVENDPNKDLAAFTLQDDSYTKIFGTADVKAFNDFIRHAKSTENAVSDKEAFARLLNARVQGLGYHMTIFPGSEEDDLVVSSELFEHDAGRVEFLSSVLPKWRSELCAAGFVKVTLDSGTFSLSDDTYPIKCKIR